MCLHPSGSSSLTCTVDCIYCLLHMHLFLQAKLSPIQQAASSPLRLAAYVNAVLPQFSHEEKLLVARNMSSTASNSLPPVHTSSQVPSPEEEVTGAAPVGGVQAPPGGKRRTFKVIVIGDSGVGKTCLTFRWVTYSTYCCTNHSILCRLPSCPVDVLSCWIHFLPFLSLLERSKENGFTPSRTPELSREAEITLFLNVLVTANKQQHDGRLLKL